MSFFEFDTSLPSASGAEGLAGDDYDACNDETFGADLGDDAWDEDATAKIVEEIEKERKPRDQDEDITQAPEPSKKPPVAQPAQEKQGNDEDDFEPNYITDSIQQMMLDDDDDDDLGGPVPFDDPAIVCVPKHGRPPVKSAPRGISPPPNLPDLDEYGSPFSTSIWAPPSHGASGKQVKLKEERPKAPPGLENMQLPSPQPRPPLQQPILPQMASRPPFEDPSVVSAMPLSSVGPPVRPQGPVKVIAQPKTLAELEQEMLANDHVVKKQEPPRVPHPQGPPPGMGHMFSSPPPMYMRMPGPMPPGAPPVRVPLAKGPIPAQIRGVPVMVAPVPMEARGPPPPHPHLMPGQMPRMNHAPLPHQQMHIHQGQHPSMLQQQQQQQQQHHPPPPLRDEYAGLMTDKDKTWLINIQLTQLQTNNPYIDDYYYSMWEMKRARTAAGVKPVAVEGTNIPDSLTSQAFAEHVLVTALKETLSAHPCAAAHVYAPPGMEKSLGKIALASALAPRKMVDVNPVNSGSQQSVLVLIENVFTQLLELEDLRRQLTVVRHEEVQQVAMNRIVRYASLITAMKPLHDRAVLNGVLAVHKGRRLLERLMDFSPVSVVLGPIISRSALSSLTSTYPPSAEEDREALVTSLLSVSCVGVFRVEDVINLLQGLLNEPSLLPGILASSSGVSLLIGLLHRAAILMEATRASNSAAAQRTTEQLYETSRAILRLLLSTSVAPLVPLPGAATRIAAALGLPPGVAEQLENRYGKIQEASTLSNPSGPATNGANLTSSPIPGHKPHRSTAASLIAAAAASASRSSPIRALNTPPLIDFRTPIQTPPLGEDRTPILVPTNSGSPK